MRLNLGCGRTPLPGWTNVDVRYGPGVDACLDLDKPGSLDGIQTGSVDVVKALGLLEHLWHWEGLVLEVARVLREGGMFEVRVPHKPDWTPYHVRYFNARTFDPFRSDVKRLRDDLLYRWAPYGSLEFEGTQYFTLEDRWVARFFPFQWHLAKYVVGECAYRIPIGKATSLNFRFRRNERPYASGDA